MSQSVWHYHDIGRIAQVLIDTGPSLEFAAGAAALARSLGATVVLPEPRGVTVVLIDPGDHNREVRR